ncbi:MAG: monogalactosyldiacylglycerol synthase [Verrucomicrobia bacterium]|nr:monogalactosyldiacylglycerol synthase [Verrucomicrobiota bacterium]
MNPRILILTAGFGEGHNAAARNLEAAFNSAARPGTATTADLFALASPRLNAWSRRGYLFLINHAPHLWSGIYWLIDRWKIFPWGLWFLRREMRILADLVAREQPDAICSTYPVYGFMVERMVRDGRLPGLPHFNVVTDSISINSLWLRPRCEAWFVPNEDSADVVHRAGIERARIHAAGFPTPAFIGENSALQPPSLEMPARGRPRILFIINSGTQGAERTARLLLAEPNWEVTCAVGRDTALRQRLERFAAKHEHPAHILGWTDQIPRLLLTHHVLVSKAGGATTQEAIAARCPMIVNQIVPGQEEGNYELLRRHGAGALAQTPTEVVLACHRAFAGEGRVWREWRRALDNLARPDAAAAIANHVLANLGGSAVAKVAFPAVTDQPDATAAAW